MTAPETEALKKRTQTTIEHLAQWSYVAKGIFFCGVAVLAVGSGLGLSSKEPNRKKVLETLFEQPFGRAVVGLMVLTLLAHTLWRLYETFADPYGKGNGPGGLLHRFTYLLSGISYGSIGYSAFRMLVGTGGGPDNEKRIWAAALLQREGGEWLVVGVGVSLLAWAGVQLKKALSPGLYKTLKTGHLGSFWRGLIRLTGGIGFTAMAAVLTGTGGYLLKAAFTRNPQWVKSLDDLFRLLGSLPGGLTWLLLVAGGLFLFGLFMFVMARYFPVKLDR